MAELRVTGKTKFAILECKGVPGKGVPETFYFAASLVCDFTSIKGKSGIGFLPPAEIIGISWHFGSFSFLVNGKITW